jgi:hypothetical protein
MKDRGRKGSEWHMHRQKFPKKIGISDKTPGASKCQPFLLSTKMLSSQIGGRGTTSRKHQQRHSGPRKHFLQMRGSMAATLQARSPQFLDQPRKKLSTNCTSRGQASSSPDPCAYSHAHAPSSIHACSPEMAIGAARSTSQACSQA